MRERRGERPRARPGAAVLLGLGIVLAVVVGAVWGRVAPPYDPLAQDFAARLRGPSREHLLGTEEFGRDVLSRLLAGAVPTLLVAT